MPSKNPRRLLPTGYCWCGCATEIGLGSFFAQGHDKTAESAVILTVYGGVPEFLVHYGFGPEGKNPKKTLDEWKSRGNKPR
jgi:hypothetical protein